ncbi:MAG: chlorophyll synthase ChlG [Roseiflexaceae bacterium]
MTVKPASLPTRSVAPTRRPPHIIMRSIALMKPVTWFAPAWAFLCGAIASGQASWGLADLGRTFLGMILAGPIVCGLSQVINDYCDRDVDAINEPQRLIPSGLVSTKQVFITIAVLVGLSLGVALILGEVVTLLTAVGMVLAVGYSANPVRAKRNGWLGNTFVAISYEGLPWLAGHASFAELSVVSIALAALFSFGTHGIMTINDFKSIEGDRKVGINTIPALYGPDLAATMVVLTMSISQLLVMMTLVAYGRGWAGLIVALLLVLQVPLQLRFIREPVAGAIRFSASASGLFVLGMLVAAIAVAG